MSALDPLDQLRKLAALKDDGIVDPDEFNRMKAELLARVSGPPAASANNTDNDQSLAIPQAPIVQPPVESRITQTDVDHWKEQLASRELELQQHAKVREGRRRRLAQLRRQIRYFNFIAWIRGHFKNVALGSLGPIVVSAVWAPSSRWSYRAFSLFRCLSAGLSAAFSHWLLQRTYSQFQRPAWSIARSL